MKNLNFENLQVVYKPLSELKPKPKNPKKHSKKQVKKIAKSIEKLGFNNPIALDKENTIVCGEARYQAAKLLDLENVPTISLEHLTKEQVRAYVIADNKLAEESEWDFGVLKVEFNELDLSDFDFELDITGFEFPEIEGIIFGTNEDQENEEEKLPEENDIPKIVQKGDLWQVGDGHYVYCGDSLKEESFKTLLGDEKAVMVFVDPPYNVKIDGHVCGSGKIKHEEFAMASGEMSQNEFIDFLDEIFTNLTKFSTNGSIHFICMDWRHTLDLSFAGEANYTDLKNICIWDKGQGGMGSLYRSQHEMVFIYKNGTEKHINNVELGKNGRYRTNVWSYKGVHATNPDSLDDLKLHPTVKPVNMVVDAILDCSNSGDIILDAVGGSGTTLLAAEKTGRKGFLIEYEEHYCDVILYRFEKMFGKEVKLVNRKESYNV